VSIKALKHVNVNIRLLLPPCPLSLFLIPRVRRMWSIVWWFRILCRVDLHTCRSITRGLRGFLSAICALDHFTFTFLRWFLFRLDYALFEFAFFGHLVVPALPTKSIVCFMLFFAYFSTANLATIFFFFFVFSHCGRLFLFYFMLL